MSFIFAVKSGKDCKQERMSYSIISSDNLFLVRASFFSSGFIVRLRLLKVPYGSVSSKTLRYGPPSSSECQIYLEGVGRWTVSTPINPDARPIGTNEIKMAARNVVCVRVTKSQ